MRGEEGKGSRNFRAARIAQVWAGEKQLRDDRGKTGNQEPALQRRSKQPPHLPSLPVSIYISIPCCSPISFPFFRNLLLPVSLGDVPTVRPWQWKKCRSSAPGSSSSSKHCGDVSWMVNAGTRCFERGPAGRPRRRWARHPGAMPTLRREALGGAGTVEGTCLALPRSPASPVKRAVLLRSAGRGEALDTCRWVKTSVGFGSVLVRFPPCVDACAGLFVSKVLPIPKIIWPFLVMHVSQQYRGILNKESGGPHWFGFFPKAQACKRQ